MATITPPRPEWDTSGKPMFCLNNFITCYLCYLLLTEQELHLQSSSSLSLWQTQRQHLIRSTGRKHSLPVYHAFPVVAQFCLDVNVAFSMILFRACHSHSSAKQKLQYSNFRNHPRGHHFLPTFHSCRRSATDSMSLLFLGFIDNKSPSLAPSPLLPRPEAGEDMLIFSDISFN